MIKTIPLSLACVAALTFAVPSHAAAPQPTPTPLADSKAKQGTADINVTGMT